MTTSTRFPNDELGSQGFWPPDTRAGRWRRYLVRAPRRAFRRLVTVAIELALIAIFMVGFTMAALFAFDLTGMLRW